MSGGIHVSQLRHPAITGEACEVGNGVGQDNPGCWDPTYHAGGGQEVVLRIRALSGCLGEFISLRRTHEVLISGCIGEEVRR